ncbi:helix-turn-helix domain-containing protein [Micromonospora rubida]|uniref:helix-turn-helix domain-containing protein n=1 Tax=Micromonospora rubida TaxID=2697657 RepID=UPI001378F1A4|nr:helix-turn-helix domain-containing protein [Micromonospora rubida]NBE84843.1 tetratricopeptide repeat protein [Micromonospora rubida]
MLTELNRLRVRAARSRGKARLSLQDLEAATGVPKSSLSNYLNGRSLMPMDVLDRLLLALGVPPAEAGAWATRWERITGDRLGTARSILGPQISAARGADPAPPTGADSPAPDRPGPALPAPAQLPLATGAFTGRQDALAELDELLTDVDLRPRAPIIGVVTGDAGVGKTTLVIHWAQRARERFPDGQLHVNLRGFDPARTPVPPAAALRDLLDAFDVPRHRIPTGLDAQINLFRTLLTGRRMLLVLDNARDTDHVRPLLPGSAGCLVLVTSRGQLPGLVAVEGARPVTLPLLRAEESRTLLTHRLGERRVAAEPSAVDELVDRCAGLPLALAVVAARAATHPHFPLAAVADELRNAPRRLDPLGGADPGIDVRAVLACSYRRVSAPAARLFRLFGLVPGPDIGIAAVASLAGVPVAQVRPPLAELVQGHLVTEHRPGRFTCHDLLRAYAGELVDADPEPDRRAATRRVLDHYLHAAHGAERPLQPPRGPIALAEPAPGVTPERLDDRAAALVWFAAEHRVLVAAVEHAADTGHDGHAWQLAAACVSFFDLRGHWHDWTGTQEIALNAARRLGDRAAEAHAHRFLGGAATRLGRFVDAHTHQSRALELFGELGDRLNQAFTHRSLGWIAERSGQHATALRHDLLALELFRRTGDRGGEARTLNSVGWCHAQLGDHRQAIADCERALALLDEQGDLDGVAMTLDSLGYVHRLLGEHARAVELYRRAREIFVALGDRHGEAEAGANLGDTLREAGDPEQAAAAWRHALAILDDVDDPKAAGVRASLDELVCAELDPDGPRTGRRRRQSG